MSDATSGNNRAIPRPSTAPAAAEVAATTASRHGHPSRLRNVSAARQEVADVIQQLRAEVNKAISGRMDMMNSISIALQKVSAKPAESKPYRISDLLPRNREGSNEKGEFRSFMSDFHL